MHEKRERQSLALHRRVAERLRLDPGLIEQARANLGRWMERHGDGPLRPAYLEWLEVIEQREVSEIIELITEESERAAQLRQNTPFAGILGAREVWGIKQSVGKEPCGARNWNT